MQNKNNLILYLVSDIDLLFAIGLLHQCTFSHQLVQCSLDTLRGVEGVEEEEEEEQPGSTVLATVQLTD